MRGRFHGRWSRVLHPPAGLLSGPVRVGGISAVILLVSIIVGAAEAGPGQEDRLLVRFDEGLGLGEGYVREAIEALGPLQRASLSMRPMLESFLRDLAGLHLLAESSRKDGAVSGELPPGQSPYEQDRALVQNLIAAEIGRLPPLEEDDLRRFYDEKREFFQMAPRIRFRQILVARRSRAEEVARLLEGGASFEELARKYSRHPSAKGGGEMGWVREDRLEPALAAALGSLEVGEVDPPIETPFGVHIVEIQEREEPVLTPFEEVRDTILRRLNLKRGQEVSERLLGREEILGSRVLEIDLDGVEKLLAEFDIRFRTAESTEEPETSKDSDQPPGNPNPGERRVP